MVTKNAFLTILSNSGEGNARVKPCTFFYSAIVFYLTKCDPFQILYFSNVSIKPSELFILLFLFCLKSECINNYCFTVQMITSIYFVLNTRI